MDGGWRYRVAGILGTLVVAAGAVMIANTPPVRNFADLVPVLSDLAGDRATGTELLIEAATTAAIVAATMVPLYKPRPRRILDIWMHAVGRTSIAVLALATVGYFDYTYRLPRETLIIASAIVFVTLPAYFVAIRRRPSGDGGRTIIIGDDPETMADILAAIEGEVIGYVSPPSPFEGERSPGEVEVGLADGGVGEALDELPCLGGLSRLDEVLVDDDVATAVLAFTHPDREEFFGALDSCYEHGVAAKVHRDHADAVLTDGMDPGELVDIDLEPWDPQDHVLKRGFDLVFAAIGLLVLSPLVLIIALAVKLQDSGSILYGQERTAAFGDTFTVFKFRSMVPDAEEAEPQLSTEDAGGADPRVTRIGRILRQTHLDEIPQLWSILVGHMSVVGPRPERPGLDADMELSADQWRSRWFVKPGLTGLAQIHGATGFDPEEKLRYDVKYIRRQSFWFDLKIVIRQLWAVLTDVKTLLLG
jgi:lipopolysaccharide/colanic/teichoic acid biosynthesis glycosyltransferase